MRCPELDQCVPAPRNPETNLDTGELIAGSAIQILKLVTLVNVLPAAAIHAPGAGQLLVVCTRASTTTMVECTNETNLV